MQHDASSSEPTPAVTCAVCGQTLPLDNPCENTGCTVKTANEMRTAAAKAAFRLGC